MTARWAAALLLLLLTARRAPAEPWESVFAGERDTTVFLGTDGSLFRAPFDLGTRRTLWAARAGQHVVRFAASPAGDRVAWITRGYDGDTTRLWVAGGEGTELRLRYFCLRPDLVGQTHAEPDVPTLADGRARGVRLVRPGALMLRSSANTLEWTADGRAVLVGYDGGLAEIPADPRPGSGVSDVLALGLDPLPPSPMFLVDALVPEPQEDRPRLSGYDLVHAATGGLDAEDGRVVNPATRGLAVLSLDSTGWALREVPQWSAARVRAAGSTTLWWARRRVVYSLRGGAPGAVKELRARDVVLWLGFDDSHGALLGVAGRQLWRMPESGGDPTPALEAASTVDAVLRSRTNASLGLVTADSLIVWNPATGRLARLAASGLSPRALFVAPTGEVLVQAGSRDVGPAVLARGDPVSGRLVPIDTPAEREARLEPIAHGAWILLYAPGSRPTRAFHVYDVKNGRWRTVDNPGLSAWEPLR